MSYYEKWKWMNSAHQYIQSPNVLFCLTKCPTPKDIQFTIILSNQFSIMSKSDKQALWHFDSCKILLKECESQQHHVATRLQFRQTGRFLVLLNVPQWWFYTGSSTSSPGQCSSFHSPYPVSQIKSQPVQWTLLSSLPSCSKTACKCLFLFFVVFFFYLPQDKMSSKCSEPALKCSTASFLDVQLWKLQHETDLWEQEAGWRKHSSTVSGVIFLQSLITNKPDTWLLQKRAAV